MFLACPVARFYELALLERRLFSLAQYVERHTPRRNTIEFWEFVLVVKHTLRRMVDRSRRGELKTAEAWRVCVWYLGLTCWRAGE